MPLTRPIPPEIPDRETIRKWLESDEGQKAVASALKEAEEFIADLRRKMRVDLPSCYEPITI